ncbi:hypothetical protein R50345_09925 [Paenibacillus sp. FSL R5-0345]|uniref:sensor histidine kinase n=1 Tax=Paenibacillus sp. FSL R5-0345 TaxID=1536770 RepID=UPI0004F696CB|nr:histidine kinase [Paenibacillus sp. FSL R5-0345]AIQ34897.1 hypothetical protein R50345_09925 [Paenibacillus sp. FSL R5-0345]
MFSKLGFQNKVIVTIMGIFFLILLLSMVYLYTYMKSMLIQTELAGLIPTTQKISDQVDTLYKQLDYAALGFTNNQDNLDVMVELNSDAPSDSMSNLVSQNKLAHNLNAIYNVVSDLHKVIVFVPDKDIFFPYFRTEHLFKNIPMPYSKPSSLNELFIKDKLFAALPPHPDVWSTEPETVISVVRKFSTPYSTDFGMLEIQLPYKSLELITRIENQQSGKQVYIFDDNGMLVFPYNPSIDNHHQALLTTLSKQLQEHIPISGKFKQEDQLTLLSTYNSGYLGWTTVVADDGISLQANLQRYRTILITIGFLTLLAVLIIYYFAIRKLMKPLKALTKTVRAVSLNNLSFNQNPTPNEHFEYNELIMLNRSFEKMIEKLKQAINTEYESRIREIEANYSALQAQINPHFLYNTLNVIAVHCEESGSIIAEDMCLRLAEMMRYSGSSSGTDVLLAEEIKYSIYYLELMKLHYENSLFYEIDIPDTMNILYFPKLSLQPFVENAINHGFDKSFPPWKITINGRFNTVDDWELVIQDNGSGFEQTVLQDLNQKLTAYRSNFIEGKLLKNLQISGMGMLNTFIRLVIHFGENFYFKVSNVGEHGARICFGVKERSDEEVK